MLIAIIAGELLALVLTLIISGLHWDMFAVLSFVIQWHILLTLAGVAPLQPLLKTLALPVQAILVWLISILSALAIQLFSIAIEFQPFSSATFGAAIIISAATSYSLYQHKHATRLTQLAAKAQAQALSARINPHFLFNTLNSIASLAATKSTKTEEAVLALAEMFRASLKQDNATHSFNDELALIEDYIFLEQLRLGERLTFTCDVQQQPKLDVPVMLLQPLVENAVKHGIAPLTNGGEVRLTIKSEADYWRISVQNPVHDGSKTGGLGIALPITEARLKLAFGEESRVIRSVHNNAYLVSLIIRKNNADRDS